LGALAYGNIKLIKEGILKTGNAVKCKTKEWHLFSRWRGM